MPLYVHKIYSFNAIVNVLYIKIDVCCKISLITISWLGSVLGIIVSRIDCVLKILVHYGLINFIVSPLRIIKCHCFLIVIVVRGCIMEGFVSM